MNTDTLFSSKSAEWRTPIDFFSKLNKIFHFTLDPAATPENALCNKFFTVDENGLIQPWYGESAFLNPPYGREIAEWMRKCFDEADIAWMIKEKSTSEEPRSLIVALIPARTDTKWMQQYVYNSNHVYWIYDLEGRLIFENPMVENATSAPFPSRLVFYGTLWEHEIKAVTREFKGTWIRPIRLNTTDNL